MKNEKGATIVEASLILPVVFFVVIIMMMLGNAYYQRTRVEAIVDVEAIEHAALAQDALLEYFYNKGSVPTSVKTSSVDLQPYRFLFNISADGVAIEAAKSEIQEKIEALGPGYFSGMDVKVNSCQVVLKNFVLYQTMVVKVSCEVKMPIRMLGSDEDLKYVFTMINEIPISDSPEFIRNVNMIIDYLEKYGVTEAIDNAVDSGLGKLKDAFGKVTSFFKQK